MRNRERTRFLPFGLWDEQVAETAFDTLAEMLHVLLGGGGEGGDGGKGGDMRGLSLVHLRFLKTKAGLLGHGSNATHFDFN